MAKASTTASYCTARFPQVNAVLHRPHPLSSHQFLAVIYGLMTRSPSLGGAAARLNDCEHISIPRIQYACPTHSVALFPSPSGTETEANPCGPGASLEEENGEDDAEGDAEAGSDEHRGKASVPLLEQHQPSCSRGYREAYRSDNHTLSEVA